MQEIWTFKACDLLLLIIWWIRLKNNGHFSAVFMYIAFEVTMAQVASAIMHLHRNKKWMENKILIVQISFFHILLTDHLM